MLVACWSNYLMRFTCADSSLCDLNLLDLDRRYIPTVRGGNFLRALRRCQDSYTGDLSKYVLNARDCGAGYTVNAVLGYVR
jgi:hypothetical protein